MKNEQTKYKKHKSLVLNKLKHDQNLREDEKIYKIQSFKQEKAIKNLVEGCVNQMKLIENETLNGNEVNHIRTDNFGQNIIKGNKSHKIVFRDELNHNKLIDSVDIIKNSTIKHVIEECEIGNPVNNINEIAGKNDNCSCICISF